MVINLYQPFVSPHSLHVVKKAALDPRAVWRRITTELPKWLKIESLIDTKLNIFLGGRTLQNTGR